jgi:glycosyltransferase involved in cell wall biosynthesis
LPKPKLVIIGARGWHNQNTFDFIDKCDSIRSLVHVHSNVSDDFVIAEQKKSKAALFPSFGEGWGLPIAEALSLGVPMICSDLPVHRESRQGLAEYLSPIDGNGWRDIIKKYTLYTTIESRRAHSQALNFRPIRWSDSSQNLINWINEI